MRAVVITEPGEPEVMQWLEVPDPVAGPGDVVIDVAAAGVNRADLMQRQGLYPPPPGAPPYPGLEVSGRVRAVGEQVTSWRPGDEVCALLAGGGYAEQVVVPAGQLLPGPAPVDTIIAAAVKEATGGAGADVILDIMGASYLARNLAALAVNGRLVVIGRQGGSRAELDLGVLQGKRARLFATP